MCMADLTSAEAAQILGVTPREVRRLAAGGQLQGARHLGRTLVVDAESVQRLAQETRHRGRPWGERIAWAALTILSGAEPSWVSPSERTRTMHRLRAASVQDLEYLASRRARVRRLRCRVTMLDDLASYVVPTGGSALDVSQLRRWGLTAADGRHLDGYVPVGDVDALAARFAMVEDTAGNVTLRAVELEQAFLDGRAPRAAVALDLADSLNTRERAAGLHELAALHQDAVRHG